MPKKPPPTDDLVPPSRVRAKPELPSGGVWFSLNLRDFVAESVTKLRDRDPETMAAFGVVEEPVAHSDEDEAAPITERSPKV